MSRGQQVRDELRQFSWDVKSGLIGDHAEPPRQKTVFD
jgi:hypothetical protein